MGKEYTPTDGDIIISSVIRAAAIDDIEDAGDDWIIIWAANAPEQIEAALAEQGYKLTKI
jgi:hypothetical protein